MSKSKIGISAEAKIWASLNAYEKKRIDHIVRWGQINKIDPCVIVYLMDGRRNKNAMKLGLVEKYPDNSYGRGQHRLTDLGFAVYMSRTEVEK